MFSIHYIGSMYTFVSHFNQLVSISWFHFLACLVYCHASALMFLLYSVACPRLMTINFTSNITLLCWHFQQWKAQFADLKAIVAMADVHHSGKPRTKLMLEYRIGRYQTAFVRTTVQFFAVNG